MVESTGIPVVNKGADMVLKYAPPIIGVSCGYLIGDVMDISSYLAGAITKNTNVAGMATSTAHIAKWVRGITAGIYALIGIMIWNWSGGNWLGGLIAGFFCGVALRGVVGLVKGA